MGRVSVQSPPPGQQSAVSAHADPAAPATGGTPSGRRPGLGWGKAISLVVMGLLAAAVIVPLASAWHVRSTAHATSSAPSDAIVVLGAAQFDGDPSPVLRNRLDHARILYDQGVAPKIITVGGKQAGDRFTEAAAGRNYLINQGVPADDVIAVESGRDTLQSMTDVAEVAQANGWDSITIVSDPVHEARTKAMAQRLGFTVTTSPTHGGPGSEITGAYVARETVGYLRFVFAQQWSVPRIVTGPDDPTSRAAQSGA